MQKRMALVVVLLALGAGAAWAQEAGTAKSEPPQAAKTTKAKPPDRTAPQAPEMARLVKMLVGHWKLDMKMEAIPEMGPDAVAGTGKGGEVVKVGPAGNSLISDLRSRSASGVFTGHGVIWWDAKAGLYRSLWCDNETPACDASGTGVWEGDNLVFTVEAEFPGPDQQMMKMKMRQVYTEFQPASFTFYIDGSISGGPMKRMITVQYSRQGPKPAAPAEKTP